MIRRGRTEGWLKLPISTLPLWAGLNGIALDGISVGPLPGLEDRGSTVIAKKSMEGGNENPLVVVPRDLVLSVENVQTHAKLDKHLRAVLDALGDYGRTARGAILLFLLMQVTISCPETRGQIGVTHPLTDYIKFLPDELLPTFWTPEERELLAGTTLQPAVEAKLKSLDREYKELRTATEHIDWCAKYWWDDDDALLTFDDWKLVDAMYRSRALEFPGIGDSMVPCVDMANHASGDDTVALYEVDDQGNAVLLLRDAKYLKQGDEVTITYGDDKGACETIFSYGFVEDPMQSAKELFLSLDIPGDDPLKGAKLATSDAAPGVRIFDKTEGTRWESDFVWLACVNEEDGLNFRILQTTDGGRELKVFWKDRELENIVQVKDLLQAENAWEVFQLRAVATIQSRVRDQLRLLYSTEDEVQHAEWGDGTGVREMPRKLAVRLRKLESELLERAYGQLEDEKTALFETKAVRQYLGAMAAEETVEEDFS